MNDYRSEISGFWPRQKLTTVLNKKQRGGTAMKITIRRAGLKYKWLVSDAYGNTLRFGLNSNSKKSYSDAQIARDEERAKWAALRSESVPA